MICGPKFFYKHVESPVQELNDVGQPDNFVGIPDITLPGSSAQTKGNLVPGSVADGPNQRDP
eukprot:6574556-Prorocentrum_lima.AAC.1